MGNLLIEYLLFDVLFVNIGWVIDVVYVVGVLVIVV